jgi:Type I restriction modification DNA specificity domain
LTYAVLYAKSANMEPQPKPDTSIQSTIRLGDVAAVFAGIGVSREDTLERSGEKLPMIGVRDIGDDAVAPISMLDTVGFARTEKADAYRVQIGDVVVTGRGTALKFGLVSLETEGAVASGNVIVIRPRGDVVPGALYAVLSSDAYRPKIELLRRGSTTLLSLSAKDLAKLELQLPPLEEQRRIAALVIEARDAYRSAINAAEIRRNLARQLIMQRLFGSSN